MTVWWKLLYEERVFSYPLILQFLNKPSYFDATSKQYNRILTYQEEWS